MIQSLPWKSAFFYDESDSIKSFGTQLTIFEGTVKGTIEGAVVGVTNNFF